MRLELSTMRIAFLADPLDRQYGGIHVYTKELLRAISKLDQKNEYIVVRSEAKNEFDGMEEIVVPYSIFPGYRFWRLFFQLPRLLTNKKVDIVVELAHFGPFNLPKSIKRVTVIHDMTVFLYPKYHVFWSQFLQRQFLPKILKKADWVITNSVNTTKDVVRFFPDIKEKSTSILLGKDSSFRPQTDSSILKKYGIKQPYLLFVGTLEPRKNVKTLIKAYDTFKRNPSVEHQLVLIGKKGWKSKEIFDAIDESPYKSDILVLGYADKRNLPVLYSMAEVFVYPSLYEGFGLPVLEAMACGTPVITSNISSLTEVGASAALFIDPDSVEELSETIEMLILNPTLQEKMRENGLKKAAEFTWDKTAKLYIELFNSLSQK